MKRLSIVIGATLLVLGAPQRGAAQVADVVALSLEPDQAAVTLGDRLDIRIDATNNGAGATPPLVIHLDITDLEESGSVDPEDWTSTLSRSIGALDPGETRTIDWQIQPISGGEFVLYAVALAPGAGDVATSTVTTVRVTDRRGLNPNGILPVAIVMPALVGLILVDRVRRRRVGPGTGPRLELRRAGPH